MNNNNNNNNTLIVHEDDGSISYYIINNKYLNILRTIDGHMFMILYNGTICKDKNFKMTNEIEDFVTKFRHGRYTKEWIDIAKLSKIEYSYSK